MTKAETDWRERARLLMQTTQDVAPPDHPARGGVGSAMHRKLFEDYRLQLTEAMTEGERWYQALIDAEERVTGDREQAIVNTTSRRPVGALGHPDVSGAVRRFWLACVALNEKVPVAQKVAPEEFVLQWLIDGGHDALARFVAGYPFWPLGLDTQDRWV